MSGLEIFHLVHVSSATWLLNDGELRQLLVQFRRINGDLGITGLLLYCDGNFIQALEGPEEIVRTAYRRIRNDRRHFDVNTIFTCQNGARDFVDWKMGFKRLSPERIETGHLDVQTDFLNIVPDTTALSPSQNLLRTFVDNNFRFRAKFRHH